MQRNSRHSLILMSRNRIPVLCHVDLLPYAMRHSRFPPVRVICMLACLLGVDLIIPLTHQNMHEDRKMAEVRGVLSTRHCMLLIVSITIYGHVL